MALSFSFANGTILGQVVQHMPILDKDGILQQVVVKP
jgi:hypothetical protein